MLGVMGVRCSDLTLTSKCGNLLVGLSSYIMVQNLTQTTGENCWDTYTLSQLMYPIGEMLYDHCLMICTLLWLYTHLCTCLHVCTLACVRAHTLIHTCPHINTHTWIHTNTCMHWHTHMHAHTHAWTHTQCTAHMLTRLNSWFGSIKKKN